MLHRKKCLGTVAYLGGVPAVPEEFCHAWGQMCAFNAEECLPGEYVHTDRAKISLHDAARNNLAERMRGEWLLMLDIDHQFEPDLAMRMADRLDQAKIDVLTGIYTYRAPPYCPVLYMKEGDFYSPIGKWWPAEEGALDIFPVDACGGGCLMVRRSVFARIKSELKESPFDRIHPFGEDMSFCKRLEKLGIKIYCDARIECHHLTTKALSLEDYDREAVTVSPGRKVNAFAMGE